VPATVVKIVVPGGTRPKMVAILREELDHNAKATVVGQAEGRIPALSRLRPCPNDQQKTKKDCCQKAYALQPPFWLSALTGRLAFSNDRAGASHLNLRFGRGTFPEISPMTAPPPQAFQKRPRATLDG
jgi:hypothetical protein